MWRIFLLSLSGAGAKGKWLVYPTSGVIPVDFVESDTLDSVLAWP